MPVALAIDPVAPPTDVRARAIEAVLTCVARHGLAKTTLDDVAREAGCARATLYRHLGGKRALVALTVTTESERIVGELRTAAAEHDTLEDAVAAVMTRAARELASHDALQFLIAFESELVLPFCTFDGGNRFLTQAGAALAPCFERFLPAPDAPRLAEWVTRVILAHCHTPDGPVDLGDDHAARTLVREFVVPGFLPIVKSSQTEPSKG